MDTQSVTGVVECRLYHEQYAVIIFSICLRSSGLRTPLDALNSMTVHTFSPPWLRLWRSLQPEPIQAHDLSDPVTVTLSGRREINHLPRC